MLKLIKHALNAADEIVENIENATEDAADKLERITDVILEDDESLKKRASGRSKRSKKKFSTLPTQKKTLITYPTKSPSSRKR